MLRTTLAILAAGTLLLALPACKSRTDGTSDNTPGKLTIEFWHYLSREQGKPLDDLLAQFEASHPDINVQSVFQGNPGQLKQKLDGSFASGKNSNPVMSLVYESWTDDFLARGYLDPLQTYIDGPDGLTPADQDDFVKAFRDGNTWDGKLVTLPFNKSIYLLYINMTMMQEQGHTTAPHTQAHLADAIRTLTRKTGNRTSTYGMGVMPKGEAFTTLLFARGGSLLSPDGKPILNSPIALESLQFLKDLQYPDKNLYVDMDYMNVPFANKQIGMFAYSTASLPYNKSNVGTRFDYRAVPIPGGDRGEPRYLMQGTNIALFANHSEKERQAAWKLIKFLTTPENGASFVSRSGYMPYRYSMMDQPVLKAQMQQDANYTLGANLVLSDKGIQEPRHRGWEGLRTEMDTMVDQLLARPDSDPRRLLDDLQKKAEAKLNQ